MSEKRLLGKGGKDSVLVTAWNVTTFTREMIREWRLCDIGGPKAGEGNKGPATPIAPSAAGGTKFREMGLGALGSFDMAAEMFDDHQCCGLTTVAGCDKQVSECDLVEVR
jgi:hypothetical protein